MDCHRPYGGHTFEVVEHALLHLRRNSRNVGSVVDDDVLFDGDVPGARIEPTAALPGLRARVTGGRSRRWLTGRAAQLGGIDITVVRDGVAAPRAARRSTIYRNTEGWLLVR